MANINNEEKQELINCISKDISNILQKQLIPNIENDIIELIKAIFYDDVKYKVVLDKTEKLLKNYKGLREHINNVKITKADVKEAERNQLRQMMKNLFTDEELYYEKLYKSKANTEILFRFL